MARGMREVLTPRTALDGAHRAIPAMPRIMEAVTARGIMRGTARRMTQAGGSRTVPGVARRMEPVTARRMVRVMAPGRGRIRLEWNREQSGLWSAEWRGLWTAGRTGTLAVLAGTAVWTEFWGWNAALRAAGLWSLWDGTGQKE